MSPCINKINPSEEQLIDAFDSIIAIKENEVLMEASRYGKEIHQYDCRVELLALYRARELLTEEISKNRKINKFEKER